MQQMQHTSSYSYSLIFYLESKQQHQLSEFFTVEKYKMDQTIWSSVVPASCHKRDCKDIFVMVFSFTFLTVQCQLTMITVLITVAPH